MFQLTVIAEPSLTADNEKM